MPIAQSIMFAAAGGVIPALVWLWFWRREDRLHPEPRWLIMLCFIGGMLAVPMVVPLEKLVNDFFPATGLAFVLWAAIEEIFKFGLAYMTVLTRKEVDEPIDDLIYMITVALGFAAMENIFFLVTPLLHGEIGVTLVTGNLRFVGAMLLHTISSATIGIFMAFGYYHSKVAKSILIVCGLFLAVVLHTLFNLSIISNVTVIQSITFYAVWLGAVILILCFEKIKKINPLEII